MKKSILVASLLCAFALASFAQTAPSAAGAKLVAERDAAYAKSHPVSTLVKTKAPKAKTVVRTKHKVRPVAAPKAAAPIPAAK